MPSLSKLTNIERRLDAIGQVATIEHDSPMAAFLADPEQVEFMRQSLIGSLSSKPNGTVGWAPDMSEEQATAYVDKLSPQQVVVRYEQRCWKGWHGGMPALLAYVRERVITHRAYWQLAEQLSVRQLRLLLDYHGRPVAERNAGSHDEGTALHNALSDAASAFEQGKGALALPSAAPYYILRPERYEGRYERHAYPIEGAEVAPC